MAANEQNKKRLRRGLAGLAALSALAVFWAQIPVAQDLERASLDYRYKHWNRTNKSSPNVVYIDIDESSLKNLASTYGRWPWPRRVYKDLLEFLSAGEPAGVFFDLLFTESQLNSDDDRLLAQASSSGSMTVSHAMNLLIEPGQTGAKFNPLPADFSGRFSLEVKGSGPGKLAADAPPDFPDYAIPNEILYPGSRHLHVVNFERDSDGVFRRSRLLYRYGREWLPSLALAGALTRFSHPTLELDGNSLWIRGTDGKTEKVPLLADGTVPIHFYDPDNSPERIGIDAVLTSAAELQRGTVADPSQLKVNPFEFKGKVIVVGGSASGLEDLKATPIAASFPGAMLNTTLISNLLDQDFLVEAPPSLRLLLTVAIFACCYLAALFLPSIWLKVGLPLGLISANTGLAIWLFHAFSLRIDMMRPAVLAVFAVLDAFAYLSFVEAAERKRLRATLVKFVSPAVAEEMIRSGKNPSAEVGRTVVLSILFSDIRGFTTMSERFKPDFLVEWLNQYFAKMTGIVFEKEGTLDKFIGDALMAFWGAPIPQAHHAALAVSTALKMRKGLRELLEIWKVKYQGSVGIDIGLGINSGEVVVGNIGSDQRLEYTVIGDNVNLASRVEGLTKFYGVGVLVSARTKELAGDAFLYRIVDCVQVKGKTKGVFLYEPLAEIADLTPERAAELRRFGEEFEAAWRCYEGGKFAEALEKFRAFASKNDNDGPCELFLERCAELAAAPPTEWSGIYVAKSK